LSTFSQGDDGQCNDIGSAAPAPSNPISTLYNKAIAERGFRLEVSRRVCDDTGDSA
jgi:hypothetical protein